MNLKKHFITGIIVLLPVALTFWIVSFIIRILTNPFLDAAQNLLTTLGLDHISFLFLSPQQILSILSTFFVLIFLLGSILCIGAVGRHIFFSYIMKIGDKVIHKIPLINTVYKTSQELIQTVLTTSNKSFKQVVLVPFPNDNSWVIGLLTRDDVEIEHRVAVFIPTTPNPTSGFLVLYEKSAIIPLDMKIEEALRYVISCGVLLTPLKRLESANIIQQSNE